MHSLESLAGRIAELESNAHKPVEGLARAADVDRELGKLRDANKKLGTAFDVLQRDGQDDRVRIDAIEAWMKRVQSAATRKAGDPFDPTLVPGLRDAARLCRAVAKLNRETGQRELNLSEMAACLDARATSIEDGR